MDLVMGPNMPNLAASAAASAIDVVGFVVALCGLDISFDAWGDDEVVNREAIKPVMGLNIPTQLWNSSSSTRKSFSDMLSGRGSNALEIPAWYSKYWR
jgi:hypothetical protein